MHTGRLAWCLARGIPSSSGSYCSSPLNPACQAPRFGSYSPLDRLFPHPLVTLCRNFQLPVLSPVGGGSDYVLVAPQCLAYTCYVAGIPLPNFRFGP